LPSPSLCLLLCLAASVAHAGDTVNRFVTARPALPLRTRADRTAPVLAEIPRGDTVTVETLGGQRAIVAGAEGWWVTVHWMDLTGWVFDGYLAPVPPAPASCGSIVDYARSLEPRGPQVEERNDEPDRLVRSTRSYAWGVTLERVQAADRVEDRLILPSLGLPEAWYLLRECLPGLETTAWPRASAGPIERFPDRVVVRGAEVVELRQEGANVVATRWGTASLGER